MHIAISYILILKTRQEIGMYKGNSGVSLIEDHSKLSHRMSLAIDYYRPFKLITLTITPTYDRRGH